MIYLFHNLLIEVSFSLLFIIIFFLRMKELKSFGMEKKIFYSQENLCKPELVQLKITSICYLCYWYFLYSVFDIFIFKMACEFVRVTIFLTNLCLFFVKYQHGYLCYYCVQNISLKFISKLHVHFDTLIYILY